MPDNTLASRFDCVMMLTWSDWRTEMRSNRYHYATRFERHLPVLFVQPDLPFPHYSFEPTEVVGVEILHIFSEYGPRQNRLLNEALLERGRLKPLLWIYNFYFCSFILSRVAPFRVYHATEDYFCSDFISASRLDELREVLASVDLLVTVSDGLCDSYTEHGRYRGESLVLSNGCDYAFWSEARSRSPGAVGGKKPVALYQGGISHKIDWNLLHELLPAMPDWEFWFCGDVFNCYDEWKRLTKHANLRSFGRLPVEKVRDLAAEATVGLIPFVQNDWIIKRSYPLKAFEYVAAGLPVVTVPVKSLLPFDDLFRFARNAEEFAESIREVAPTRRNATHLQKRAEAAKTKDYDVNFQALLGRFKRIESAEEGSALNCLMLYDDRSTHVNTVAEHLRSFAEHSRHRFSYAVATGDARGAVDLSLFDFVVIHYSVRVSLEAHLSRHWVEALRGFGGYKVLVTQDEYDTTEIARRWMERLGIHLVFTCVPEPYIAEVYPSSRFPSVEFEPTLTGYVPQRFERDVERKPLEEREFVIGYRGRSLPYWYGKLGQEKIEIGRKMKKICAERSIPADIEWDHERRIYGEGWYRFLENCRAMLGSESGANVFDDTGSIRRAIEDALARNPDLTFDEAFERFLVPHEGRVKMNQVSPKIFEAIALRTALILYEGEYSGAVEPEKHYIPLKNDFSNIDHVLQQVQDDEVIRAMTQRAYRDVIQSGQYSYRAFVRGFDEAIDARMRHRVPAQLLQIHFGGQRANSGGPSSLTLPAGATLRDVATSLPLTAEKASHSLVAPQAASTPSTTVRARARFFCHRLLMAVWTRMPPSMKRATKTVLVPVKPLVLRLLRA